MIISSKKAYPFYMAVDLLFLSAIFFGFYIFKYSSPGDILNIEFNLPSFREYSFVFLLWSIFIIILFSRRNLYTTDRALTIPREIFKVVTSIVCIGFLMATLIFFAQYKFFSREIFLKSILMLCVCLSGWRVIKRIILRKLIVGGFHNVNVLIVGAGRVGKFILEEINSNPVWGFNVVGFLDDHQTVRDSGLNILGKVSNFSQVVKKYFVEEVIITLSSEKDIVLGLIGLTRRLNLGLRIVPVNFENILSKLHLDYIGTTPLLTCKERRRHPAEVFLKRLFDFFVSLILLILLLPLILIIAIVIKIDSKGPIFYTQERSGFKGIPFTFYKFRSMTKNADKLKEGLLLKNEVKDGVMFKIKKDPRITRTGKFLRKFSLDELPQLFNVLKGDLSLVGPRAPTPEEVKKYNHNQMQRLSIRPGITGLSQVKGRSELSFKKWVKWDLWYINNWSFGLDLLILFWTIPVVVKGKGAY